jgi:hypothetical protein
VPASGDAAIRSGLRLASSVCEVPVAEQVRIVSPAPKVPAVRAMVDHQRKAV